MFLEYGTHANFKIYHFYKQDPTPRTSSFPLIAWVHLRTSNMCNTDKRLIGAFTLASLIRPFGATYSDVTVSSSRGMYARH